MERLMFLGMTVYPYGLCIAVGTLAALVVMGVMGYFRRLPAGTVRVFGLLGIPLGILFARLFFCAFNLGVFMETYENPWLMLRFFDGGFSMTGLLCGLVLSAYLTSRLIKARFGEVLDCLAGALGLLIFAVCAGQGYTELGVGKVVEESWVTHSLPFLFLQEQMGVNVEYRMAAYRYEAAAGLLLFAAALCLFRPAGAKKGLRTGDLSLILFSLYGAMQTLLESLRDDGHMMITFLRIAQLAAALMPLIATGILSRRYARLTEQKNHRLAGTWIALALCMLGLVLLEFSLDGRLTWGQPSMARDYGIMFALCGVMAAMPCSLCRTLNQKLYQKERFQVRIAE